MPEALTLKDIDPKADPWNTARLARAATQARPQDDGAWAMLGLALALLGHYHAAVAAYRRARAIRPGNPWYAHNLGHLIDVALQRPGDALLLLSFANHLQPGEPDIVSSYAHALAAVGRHDYALRVLDTAKRGQDSREHVELRRWILAGAPRAAEPYQVAEGVSGLRKDPA